MCRTTADCPNGYGCVGPLGECASESCGPLDQGALCAVPGDVNAGTCCSSGCSDTLTDPNNCGGCGTVCGSNTSCSDGSCVVASCDSSTESQACALSDTSHGICCGSTCIDAQTDVSNCGSCGVSCGTGNTCASGNCNVASCTAQTPSTFTCTLANGSGNCCGTTCADLTADDSHCGSCAIACVGGTHCAGGNCISASTGGGSGTGGGGCSSLGAQGKPCEANCGCEAGLHCVNAIGEVFSADAGASAQCAQNVADGCADNLSCN